MAIQVTGTYEKTIYRDEKTASTIFALKVSKPMKEQNRYGCIVCTGKLMAYPLGMPLEVTGVFRESNYGLQFTAERIRECTWDDISAVNYLSSGEFDGVGYAAARELVEKLGYEVFHLAQMPNAAENMRRQVRKLGRETAKKLCEKLICVVRQRELFEYLLSFDGTWTAVERLIKTLGNDALAELKSEPYNNGMQCGLGFYLCDKIAKSEGMHPLSCTRIQAILKTAIRQLAGSGHVFAPIGDVCRMASQVTKRSSFTTEIPTSLIVSNLKKHPDLVTEEIDTTYVYLKSLYEAEVETAEQVRRLLEKKKQLPFEETLILYAEKKCNMRYEG